MTMRRMLIPGLLLVIAACSGGLASGTIDITGTDYMYSGVPEEVATGAEFTFTNDSQNEVHEIVMVRIADDETRSLDELLELSDEESAEVTEFKGVLVALPGTEGANPEGPGTSITMDEPGRYAIVCFIPEGADPDVVAEAMQNPDAEGPPDMGDGTPHAFLGMVAEFEVKDP
jgi:plastocyanin